MKQIIDGKLYDTEKANLILEFRRRNLFALLVNDVSNYWLDGELYQTNKGSWFEVVADRMNVLTEDEVKELIKQVDPDKYIELYDDIEEA